VVCLEHYPPGSGPSQRRPSVDALTKSKYVNDKSPHDVTNPGFCSYSPHRESIEGQKILARGGGFGSRGRNVLERPGVKLARTESLTSGFLEVWISATS
jgi:hypothetical protein